MRLFRASIALFLSLGLILLFTACGGGTSKPNVASTITISSNNISLVRGEVMQLSPTATNSSGQVVTVDFVYSTGDPSLVTVSSTGLVCAGVWDAVSVVCKPTSKVGTTTVTISAKNSSATLPVTTFVHEAIDSIQAVQPTDCVSASKTLQLTAKAYSTNSTVCAGLGGSVPCELPKNSIGDFTWLSGDPLVVTIDNATNPSGLATAQHAGTARVYAVLGETHSNSAVFTTCPIVSLQIARSDTNDTTPFSLDVNGTKDFNAIAIDSKGETVANPQIAWYSNNYYAYSITPGSTSLTATATATKAASTAMLSVSCSDPNCNRNLSPIWAEPVVATVNGTTAGAVVYAASTQSTTMYPVDGTTVGTAITLPRLPNSFIMNNQGSGAILGSDAGGLMFFDPTTLAVTSLSSISAAKVLAVSQSGVYGAAANSTDLYFVNVVTQAQVVDIKLPGITSVAFVPGTAVAFASKGDGTVYKVNIPTGVYTPFSTTAAKINGIAVVNNGPVTYLAQPGGINTISTCDPSQQIDTQVATSPTVIQALPTAQGVVAIDLPNMIVVNSSNISQACKPTIANTRAAFDLGLGSATPTELAITPDGSKAAITTNSDKLAVIDIKNAKSTVVRLASGATAAYHGDITADGLNYYVGASDGTLHRIDLSAASDAQQIAVGLKQSDGSTTAVPDLVQLKGK